MLTNLVNSIFGREDPNTADSNAADSNTADSTTAVAEASAAESAAPVAGARAQRNGRKKGSKSRYNERRKKARAAATMEAGKVLHATDKNFQAMVLSSDVPVVVDYWAPWCGPCKAMGPVLDELAAQMGQGARVVKLNVDENPRTSARYNIRSIPTIMIFAHGEVQDVLVGLQSKDRLANLLQKAA